MMDIGEIKNLSSYLSQFVTQDRLERISEVLSRRTRKVTVMLEDIYQPHNASAVLRSCDAFGVQDVHIVENFNRFSVSRGVTIGTEQWLTLHRYNEDGVSNTRKCIEKLKGNGYTLVATTPHEQDETIDQLQVDQPVALMFGAELDGLSDEALNMADRYVKIPIVGFVESFNISVSAAICLYEITRRLRVEKNNWGLSAAELEELKLNWLRKSVRRPDLLEKEFYKGNR